MDKTIEAIFSETMKALPISLAGKHSRAAECDRMGRDPVVRAKLKAAVTELQRPSVAGASSRRRKRWIDETHAYAHLAEVDRNQIIRALKETDGRIGGPNGAANRLGLKRITFMTRMKKLGIRIRTERPPAVPTVRHLDCAAFRHSP
jgi:transcriptional regulator with GAF, ATPase, and Fis domain